MGFWEKQGRLKLKTTTGSRLTSWLWRTMLYMKLSGFKFCKKSICKTVKTVRVCVRFPHSPRFKSWVMICFCPAAKRYTPPLSPHKYSKTHNSNHLQEITQNTALPAKRGCLKRPFLPLRHQNTKFH